MSLLTATIQNHILTLTLCSRIDANNINDVQKELDKAIAENSFDAIIADAVNLEYISSIGLRVLLTIKKEYENFKIINVSAPVYEIFDMTGFTDIMNVQKAFRCISIDNCEMLGKGACGTAYKLNDETIVKVFVDNYPFDKILKERENSRNAFTHGIDTAIPFDIVKIGQNYGLIYEIIKADTVKNKMLKERDKLEYYIGIYADYIRHMHNTQFETDCYPSMKTVWKERIDALEGVLTDEEKKAVKKYISAIPDRNTFVHGDINFGNLMTDNGKAVMIDMEDAMLGHPVYDIAFLYYMLKLLPELLTAELYQSVLEFTAEEAELLWNAFAKKYFNCQTQEELTAYEAEIHPYGLIRLLDGVSTCCLIFGFYGEKTKHIADSVYKPTVERRKQELLEIIKQETSPLKF